MGGFANDVVVVLHDGDKVADIGPKGYIVVIVFLDVVEVAIFFLTVVVVLRVVVIVPCFIAVAVVVMLLIQVDALIIAVVRRIQICSAHWTCSCTRHGEPGFDAA